MSESIPKPDPLDDTQIYEITKKEYVNGAGGRVTFMKRAPILAPERVESKYIGHVVITMAGPGGQQMKREIEVELPGALTPQVAFIKLREEVENLKKQAEDSQKPGIIVPSSSELGKKKIDALAKVNEYVRQPSFGGAA